MKQFDEKLLFSKTVLKRMDQECSADADIGQPEYSAWLAVGVTNDGKAVIARNYQGLTDQYGIGYSLEPPAHQVAYLEGMARLLDQHAHHDGKWIVGLTHAPDSASLLGVEPNLNWRRIVKVWLDQQGDPQFSLECSDPFEDVVSAPDQHFIEQAEQAWTKWHHLMRDVLDPAEHQLENRAILNERK